MAKELIVLVHGMGDTTNDWSAEWQELLRDRYQSYDVSRLMRFDDLFEFVEINYNNLFDDRRDAWKNAAAKVIDAMQDSGLSAKAARTLADLASKPADDTFFNTHWLDVMLYRFIPPVAEQVRTRVEVQMLEALRKRPANEVTRWSILAHSLGTSVTHDVLHQMFSPNRPAARGILPPGVLRPRVLMMTANVSRLLESRTLVSDVYQSAVHPSESTASGACDYFLNVRNEWDPIPKPKMFRPTDDWPDPLSRAQDRYRNILINSIENVNVHDVAHYYRNPRTHIPLFRLLTVPALLPDAEASRAIAAFDAATPLARVAAERKKLQKLSLADDERDWSKILQMLVAYFNL